jgi:tRNA (guanine37-N1)-methyltransferase
VTIRFDILTLHPDLVQPLVTGSILGRAREAEVVDIRVHDIRDHAEGRHRTADDAPYGGGAGMVMKVDVVARAVQAVRTPEAWVVLTTPAGRVFDSSAARELATRSHVVVVCGHYEGIDARIESLVDEEISLGDFVLTGGEIAAAAIVDATARLVPGVLGNEASATEESFVEGLLEYPQYTRPAVWNGLEVPEVLLSGHHERILQWRRAQAEARTRVRRPDLWARYQAHREGAPGAPEGDVNIDETGSDE